MHKHTHASSHVKQSPFLSSLTAEQRSVNSEKAKLKKLQNKQAGLAAYKQQWQPTTMAMWHELASKYGIRLPSPWEAPKAGKLRKLATRLGIEIDREFSEAFFGLPVLPIQRAIDRENAALAEGEKYSMQAFVGWLLEYKYSNECKHA